MVGQGTALGVHGAHAGELDRQRNQADGGRSHEGLGDGGLQSGEDVDGEARGGGEACGIVNQEGGRVEAWVGVGVGGVGFGGG